MPIFEFECNDCGNTFETLTNGREEISCPQCDSANLKKLISACGTTSDDTKCNWDDPSLPNKQEFQRLSRKGK
ncbi:FmdB family zinc ribbon protein [Thiovibrio frasassiensis]|uniref:FmdB family zinc ribbon protein n=1 Tax=Thiovibrio frasassiensis TaxID=2984131 RepID=UPI0035314CD1